MFVIDQVDAFVRASKQTLLYNVLDALTSSQVQVRGPGGSICIWHQVNDSSVQGALKSGGLQGESASAGLDHTPTLHKPLQWAAQWRQHACVVAALAAEGVERWCNISCLLARRSSCRPGAVVYGDNAAAVTGAASERHEAVQGTDGRSAPVVQKGDNTCTHAQGCGHLPSATCNDSNAYSAESQCSSQGSIACQTLTCCVLLSPVLRVLVAAVVSARLWCLA